MVLRQAPRGGATHQSLVQICQEKSPRSTHGTTEQTLDGPKHTSKCVCILPVSQKDLQDCLKTGKSYGEVTLQAPMPKRSLLGC